MNGGPQSLTDWISYLHNASQVKPGSPDYREAREAIGLAIRHINALNVGAAESEATANEQPNLGQSVATVIGQGPGLGTGEVFRGIGTALTGQGFRKGAQEYREAVDQAEAANPKTMATGELLGSLLMPAGKIGRGLKVMKAGVPLGMGGAAKLIGQGALTGAVPAALAGFSSGGADPGDLGARVSGAKRGAILGALLGAGTTAAAMPVVRGHLERTADIANKGVMRKLQEQRLRNAQSAGLRYAGVATDVGTPEVETAAIERELEGTREATGPLHPDAQRAIRDFEAGKITGEDLRTALDKAAGRGGTTELPVKGEVAAGFDIPPKITDGPPGSGQEQLEPIPGTQGRGLAVTGQRRTPPEGTKAPSLAELTGTAQLGETADRIQQQRQGTLPYYPRGGRVEQSVGAKPVESLPAPLSKTNLRTADPGTIATFLKNQIALAEATGSPVTPSILGRLLEGIGMTPDKMTAVLKALQTP